MRKIFRSLSSSQIGYAYDSDYMNTQTVLCDHFRKFSTFGDDLIAHSFDSSVQPADITDYLRSMAVAMAADHELAKAAAYRFAEPTLKDFQFAASVVYREPKDNGQKYYHSPGGYFSLSERKVGTAKQDKLQYDKRYSNIEKWADGGHESICRVLHCNYHDFFRAYVISHAAREYIATTTDHYPELPNIPGKAECTWQEKQEFHGAYQVCQRIITAVNLLVSVESSLKRWSTPAAEDAVA